MKSRSGIAREVIAGMGGWGSGTTRVERLRKAGYNPDQVQGDVNTILCCRQNIITNMKAMAKKIADNNNWWYIYWTEKYGHECAICHPHGGENHGWQCIGTAMAIWHHAGLPIPCNCGVIANDEWEKILKAKTDADALKIAQKLLKIKEIKVIRNKNGIPKSDAKAGDMAAIFHGTEYYHTFIVMSSSKLCDATTQSPKENNIRADRSFSGAYVSDLKVLIRYTGKGLCSPPKRTIDQLAYEVIANLWGSGDARVTALKQAGHDYDAVQKRVNEILNPPKPSPGKRYTGQLPSYRLVKSNAEVIADTITFAKWIAANHDFHYGHGEAAHKCGCYFCKTQPKSKKNAGIKMYEHSQCCNPFVHSCFAHGGCIPSWLAVCLRGGAYDWNSYPNLKDFKRVTGTPKAGDIVCSSKIGHTALSLGGNKVIEASGGDDNVIHSKKWNNSIRIDTWSDYTAIYRYTGSVDADVVMRHGEISKRVLLWQDYLNWWSDGAFYKECGKGDGIYGDKTYEWTVKFQEKVIGKGTGDGTVGPITLKAAANYVK